MTHTLSRKPWVAAALAGLLLLSPVAFGQNDTSPDDPGQSHTGQSSPTDTTGAPTPDRSDAESKDLKKRQMLLASHPLSIKVQSSEFGHGVAACDTTQVLRERCDGRERCDIEVNKSLCPGRQLPGMIQPLRVSYICRVGEEKRLVSAEEPNRLRLLCEGNHGRRD